MMKIGLKVFENQLNHIHECCRKSAPSDGGLLVRNYQPKAGIQKSSLIKNLLVSKSKTLQLTGRVGHGAEIRREYPTNTPRMFHVETRWKQSFPRRFNVEYTWCV